MKIKIAIVVVLLAVKAICMEEQSSNWKYLNESLVESERPASLKLICALKVVSFEQNIIKDQVPDEILELLSIIRLLLSSKPGLYKNECFHWNQKYRKFLVNIINNPNIDIDTALKDVVNFHNSFDGNSKQKVLNGFLSSAVYDRDIALIKLALKLGGDVNAQLNEGTILEHSVFYNKEEIIRTLFDSAFDVNYQSFDYGNTPLMLALKYKDIAQKLLDKGANVNLQDDRGETALMKAANQINKEVVQMLINAQADVNVKDAEGNTALKYAICSVVLDETTQRLLCIEEIIQILIDAGADINTCNNWGDTPLIYCARWGHKEKVKMLLDKGADPNVRNNKGENALTAICGNAGEKKEIIEMLTSSMDQS